MYAPISVASLNLMRDDPHERVRSLQFRHREDRIIKQIRDMNVMVVCLQEARDLENQPMQSTLDKLTEYQSVLHEEAKDPKLRVVTLYKPKMMNLIQSTTYWLNDSDYTRPITMDSQKYPRPVGCCLFLLPSSQYLLVVNTHFGHSTQEKMKSVVIVTRLLNYEIRAIVTEFKIDPQQLSVIFTADCNFFDNDDALRYKLCNAQLTSEHKLYDLSYSANYLLENPHSNASLPRGTFVGSSIDFHKPPLGQIGKALDIICGSNFYSFQVTIWNKTMIIPEPEFLSSYDLFPSDHLPLFLFAYLPNWSNTFY